MRISNSDLTGTAAAEAARAQETPKSERGDRASLNGASTGDRVEFSAGLGQLAHAISTYGAERTAQVQSLATLYQSGGYRPDSAATSRAMVAEALARAWNRACETPRRGGARMREEEDPGALADVRARVQQASGWLLDPSPAALDRCSAALARRSCDSGSGRPTSRTAMRPPRARSKKPCG